MKKLFLPGICIISCCHFSNAQKVSQLLVSEAAFQSTTADYAIAKTSTSILAGSILNVAEDKTIADEKSADNFIYESR